MDFKIIQRGEDSLEYYVFCNNEFVGFEEYDHFNVETLYTLKRWNVLDSTITRWMLTDRELTFQDGHWACKLVEDNEFQSTATWDDVDLGDLKVM
jgi:hypothetical protein